MTSLLKILRINLLRNQLIPTVRNVSSQTTVKTPQISLTSIINPWIIRKENELKLPISINDNRINLPSGMFYVPKIDKIEKETIQTPSNSDAEVTIEAARLIVIRRKKMKKHKLKKLRKKMRFEWAKVRQKRELKKEKLFQAGLIQKCKEAEAFSAENYVNERLEKLNEFILPRYWKGRRLPEFLIREKLGLPPKK